MKRIESKNYLKKDSQLDNLQNEGIPPQNIQQPSNIMSKVQQMGQLVNEINDELSRENSGEIRQQVMDSNIFQDACWKLKLLYESLERSSTIQAYPDEN